jgi:hypothetical protein
MLHSETLGRIIHAERMRDLERAARDRRLLMPADEPLPIRESAIRPRIAPTAGRGAHGDSASQPV